MRTGCSRLPWMAWGLALCVVVLASLFGRPDIPIDETRYVSVAWEMWSGGDWLVLHRNGIPYHHKPPLLFWLIGLGWGVFGVNDWWPRCISALFSLLCVWLVVRLAQRLWPADAALPGRAGWGLLGGAFWLFFSTAVVFDVLLTAFVLLALLALLRTAQGEMRGTWGLFALAIGLGVLAKGPVVLLHVLPTALLVRWWHSAPERGWRGWYGRLGLGVLGGAALALCWAIPAAWLGGEEFRQAIFWGQTAGRVSGQLAHRQPFWFYLAVLPLLLFPWVLSRTAWSAWRSLRPMQDRGVRFCLAWALPALVGFSLSGGKQAHYLLPLYPVAALLLARGLGLRDVEQGEAAECEQQREYALAISLLVLGGGLLSASWWLKTPWLQPYLGTSWLWSGLVMVALAGGLLWMRRASTKWLALGSLCLVVLLQMGVLRPLWATFDMEPMGAELHRRELAGVPLAHASAYNDQYHFYGRLLHPLQELGRGEVAAWLRQHPDGRVVVYLKRVEEAAGLQAEAVFPYLDGAVALIGPLSADAWQAMQR